MATFRTRNCFAADLAKTCLWLMILYHTTDSVRAQYPRTDPLDPSTIVWGDLPPVPTATNDTITASRPSTLATMAEGFVDLVQPNGLPLDYIRFVLENVYNETSTYYEDNWQTEMWKIMGLFVGIVVCVLFGALYFIIVPITGFIFSCCRCCDRCGGKRVQRESKHMGCKRVTLTLFFFSFTGIICAGMAFTNVSNEFLKTSVDVFKSTADSSLGDLESYLNAINEQITYMVETQYGYVDTLLTTNLKEIGTEIGDPVEAYLLEDGELQGVLDSINNISSTFNEMEETLNEIENLRSTLINQTTVLESELNQVVTNLNAINNECGDCIPDVDQLVINVDYTKLPSVETQIAGVEEANMLATNITNEINAVLDDIPAQITDMTATDVQTALDQLEQAEEEVTSSFDDINKTISDFVGTLSGAKQDLDESWNDVTVYTQYVYYALIGLTCTVLLIVMFNLIGLTMGTFSYKNVHPMERSRMSNAGGNVLMAGVFFTFLFAPFLMLMCCVAFGVMSLGTLSCAPLLNYDLFKETIDQPNVIVEGYYLGDLLLNNSSIPLTASGILTNCSEGSTAYMAFQLDELYGLDEIKKQLDQLEDEFDSIIGAIDPNDLNYDFPFTDFLTDLDKLRDTTELGSVNYTQFDELLGAEITGINLTEYANNLTDLATTDPVQNVAANITAEVTAIREIQSAIVEPMQSNAMSIQSNLDALLVLQEQLDRQINQTIDAVGIAEAAIESNATSEAVLNISQEYAERLLGYGFQFYYQFEYQLKNDFAECKLISSLYAYSIQSTCDYPISSLNTFWFTVGWCVFFYVPSIIFAVKLAKYYRIMDEEAAYRAPKKSKKKKKNQERRESDEEMAMDDMDHGTGPDNIRLVDNGRPTSMMPQQNPHYVQDEPILAYNDLGRPMAPPPAYNPGYPKGAPPTLPPIESTQGYGQPRPSSRYYEDVPLRVDLSSPPPHNSSINMYQYNRGYNNQQY